MISYKIKHKEFFDMGTVETKLQLANRIQEYLDMYGSCTVESEVKEKENNGKLY